MGLCLPPTGFHRRACASQCCGFSSRVNYRTLEVGRAGCGTGVSSWLLLLLSQVFKISLEYWNFFVPDVFSSVSTLDTTAAFAFGGGQLPNNRKGLYSEVLSRLRLLMISRMAKPEEVGALV